MDNTSTFLYSFSRVSIAFLRAFRRPPKTPIQLVSRVSTLIVFQKPAMRQSWRWHKNGFLYPNIPFFEVEEAWFCVLHKLSLFIIWIHLATSVHTKRAVMDVHHVHPQNMLHLSCPIGRNKVQGNPREVHTVATCTVVPDPALAFTQCAVQPRLACG